MKKLALKKVVKPSAAKPAKSSEVKVDKAVEKNLKKISGWTLNAKVTEISKTFEFESFIKALEFVAKVAVHAEILNHHPTIELSFGRVKVRLTTDEAKGLTNLDFELAKRIDGLEKR